MNAVCVVCGETNSKPLYPKYNINTCNGCGHVYYTGNLSDEDIKKIYKEEYFSGNEYSSYVSDKKIIQRNFKDRVKHIQKYKPDGKLIEIGSAYGFFMELANEHYEAKGYEICPEAAAYAREQLKLNVTDEDFLVSPIPENSVDVVCMYDCIEHLKNPEQFVEKIKNTLKPGGHFFLTTGDVGKFVPRFRKEKWRLINPPTHIHYFSKDTITKLLNQHGLKVVNVRYPGLWRSNQLLINQVFRMKKLARMTPGYFWINTFDIMEVTAVKN
ncbi:MAG: class I SAM-dependent methyltransferase [Bacteriovorax sp.]